jgi:hypothetical protein
MPQTLDIGKGLCGKHTVDPIPLPGLHACAFTFFETVAPARVSFKE